MSLTLNLLGTSRGNQEKRLDDIVVRSYQLAEQDAVLQHASCRTLLVFILVPRTPGNVDVTTEHCIIICIASSLAFVKISNLKGLGQNHNDCAQRK